MDQYRLTTMKGWDSRRTLFSRGYARAPRTSSSLTRPCARWGQVPCTHNLSYFTSSHPLAVSSGDLTVSRETGSVRPEARRALPPLHLPSSVRRRILLPWESPSCRQRLAAFTACRVPGWRGSGVADNGGVCTALAVRGGERHSRDSRADACQDE